MNTKNLTSLISATSVFVMLVWGTIAHTYEYSWLAVPAGGILIALVTLINNSKTKEQ